MRGLIVFIALITTSIGSYAEDFKTTPLSSAFLPSRAQPKNEYTLPLSFAVPISYEKRDVPEEQTVLWGTKEDIDTVLASKSFLKIKNGVFSLKISLNTGYDTQAKKFSNEEQMAGIKGQPGYSDVNFQKNEIRGIPMATFTAVNNNRHLFLHFVAIGNAALLINYFPAESFSARDSDIWKQFIDGLKVQP
jgi:hypothetical protein